MRVVLTKRSSLDEFVARCHLRWRYNAPILECRASNSIFIVGLLIISIIGELVEDETPKVSVQDEGTRITFIRIGFKYHVE